MFLPSVIFSPSSLFSDSLCHCTTVWMFSRASSFVAWPRTAQSLLLLVELREKHQPILLEVQWSRQLQALEHWKLFFFFSFLPSARQQEHQPPLLVVKQS